MANIKNIALWLLNKANWKKAKVALMTIAWLWVAGIQSSYAVLTTASWVTLESSDLTNVWTATQAYATTSFEVFKLLGFFVMLWWVRYIIWKVFWLFGWKD